MDYFETNDPKKEKIQDMAKYTTTQMREKCWEVRDNCFNCLDTTHNRGKCRKVCQDFFSGEYCLQSWIRHFSNKRRYANAWDFYKQQRQEHYQQKAENNDNDIGTTQAQQS
eukprot:UN10430